MKQSTLKHIYLGYSYKTYDINSSTIPVPYFPKTEITSHKYSITYKEWKKYIFIYLKHLIKYLITGKTYSIPAGLGDFTLRKYKPKERRVNIYATQKKYGEVNKTLPKGSKKFIYHDNSHTQGFCPIFKWERVHKKFLHKWTWRFKLNRILFKDISLKLESDSSFIHRLQGLKLNYTSQNEIRKLK